MELTDTRICIRTVQLPRGETKGTWRVILWRRGRRRGRRRSEAVVAVAVVVEVRKEEMEQTRRWGDPRKERKKKGCVG